MTDIVERLRQVNRELVESDGAECEFAAYFREAADEIEHLTRSLDIAVAVQRELATERDEALAEIERLQEYKRLQTEDIINLGQQVGKLEAEAERLRAERDDLDMLCIRGAQEIARLRAGWDEASQAAWSKDQERARLMEQIRTLEEQLSYYRDGDGKSWP